MSDQVTISLPDFAYNDTRVRPSEFPPHVVSELVRRAVFHILGPEVASKMKAINTKRVKDGEAEMTAEERATESEAARDAYLQSFYDGTWGSGARAPRAPAADRQRQLFDRIVLDAIKAILGPHIKSGQMQETTLDGELAWVQDGNVVPLSEWTRRYFNHPTQGEERKQLHERQAAEKFAAERRAAELKAQAAKLVAPAATNQDYI